MSGAVEAIESRPPHGRSLIRHVAARPDLVLAAAAAAVLVFGATTTDSFLTTDNFKAILANVGVLGLVAAGMTCITLSGSLFSLSLGTVVTVCDMMFLSSLNLGLLPALGLALLLGVLICAVQGGFVGWLGANPIIVTIAAGALALGLAAKLTDSASVYAPKGFDFQILASTVWGIPVSVFAFFLVVGAIQLWLAKARLGQEMVLVGENRPAARAAGLRVTTVSIAAFGIAGACAAAGGIFLAATERNATLLTGGDLYTYDAIAAVLVGGTAVAGGSGSLVRTLFGVLFIAAISDMLLLRDYSVGAQIAVRGVVVVLVIVALELRRRRQG